MRIAVIGAGFCGLTVALELAPFAEVCLFEKSRGVGGRMATRYAGLFHFDHGAQFFTARTAEFKEFLKPHLASGTVVEWRGKVVTIEQGVGAVNRPWLEPHYVAAPNMNSLCKVLAQTCQVRLNMEVAPLTERRSDGWHLTDTTGLELGKFDWVISTAPALQTKRLFAHCVPAKGLFADVELLGCFTLMLGFPAQWERDWIAAKIRSADGHSSPIEWIGVNSSKPQRDSSVTSLVVHSRNDWAQTHIDDDIQLTQTYLLGELAGLIDIDISRASYASIHRWRYALVKDPKPITAYLDQALCLASVGDWCSASRIEDVWKNANLLAKRLGDLISA